MYCIKCGVGLADTEHTCPLCGTRVYHPDLPMPVGAPLYPENKLPKVRSGRKALSGAIIILFLIPGTPKDVMIYALGLTPMGIWQGVLLSTVARIPSIITSTLSGHALGEKQYLAAVIIYGITGILSLIAILIYRRKSKVQ